jgi:TusA-related sulfurtransferase
VSKELLARVRLFVNHYCRHCSAPVIITAVKERLSALAPNEVVTVLRFHDVSAENALAFAHGDEDSIIKAEKANYWYGIAKSMAPPRRIELRPAVLETAVLP